MARMETSDELTGLPGWKIFMHSGVFFNRVRTFYIFDAGFHRITNDCLITHDSLSLAGPGVRAYQKANLLLCR